jgi:hypothetical protein
LFGEKSVGTSLKPLALLFIAAIAASSLLMVVSVSAQSIPKPSVPEFTVTLTDYSYDVQATATSTTDPYDGQIKTETTPGYHVKNATLTVAIKNQPFTIYYNADGFPIKLYYHIQMKGHSETDWPGPGQNSSLGQMYFPADNSSYTLCTSNYFCSSLGDKNFEGISKYPTDGKVDIQVEAFIGYVDVTNIDPASLVVRPDDLTYTYFGENSGWSSTQTITFDENAAALTVPSQSTEITRISTPAGTTVSANPIEESNIVLGLNWEQAAIVLFCIILIPLTVLLLILFRRQNKQATKRTLPV